MRPHALSVVTVRPARVRLRIGALIVCSALVAVSLRAQRGAVAQAYQLSHSQTYDPSPSPDGKRMVYITAVAGREQLFVMNVDGTGIAQLTHDVADHEDPAWSRDGLRIYFPVCRKVDFGTDCEIFAARTNGFER